MGRIFVSLLLLACQFLVTDARFGAACRVSGPVVELARDANGTYYLVDNGDESQNGSGLRHGRRRLLVEDDDDDAWDMDSFRPTLQVTARRLGNDTGVVDRFAVRECGCAPDGHYCPAFIPFCADARRFASNQTPGCLSKSSRVGLYGYTRTFFMIVLVWFALLLICVLCTRWGHNVCGCFLTKIVPGYNRAVASRMLRKQRDLALHMVRNNLRNRRRYLERRYRQIMAAEQREQDVVVVAADATQDNNTEQEVQEEEKRKPTALALRTRIFCIDNGMECLGHKQTNKMQDEQQPQQEQEDFLNDNTCTICFSELMEGDRVGDLPCGHTFHVDCLKSWLPRRNVCPLCNTADIAEERFDDVEPRPTVATLPPIE